METAVKDNSFNMVAKCRICSTIFCCTDKRISHERRLHPKELRNILSDISNQHNLNVTVSSVKVRAVNKEETKSLKFLKSTHSPDCTGKREREEVGSPKLQPPKKKKKSVGLLPHLRTARYSPKSSLAIVNNGIILRSPKECLKSPLATIDDGVSTTTCSDITPSPLAKVDDSLIPKTPSQSSLTANGVSLRTPDECLRNLQANVNNEVKHDNTVYFCATNSPAVVQSEMSHTVGGTLSRSQSSELDESLIREFNVSRDISFRVNSSMLAGFGLNTLTSDIEANDSFICFNGKLKNHPHITYERENNQDLLELDFQNVGSFGQKLEFLSPETTKENESATDISEIADERQQDNIDNSPVEGFGYVNTNTKEIYIPVKCFDTELSTIYGVSTFALSSMSAADCTELSRIKHETSNNTYPSEEASEISTSDDLGQQNYKIKIDDIQPDQTSIVLKCVSSIAEKIVSLLPFKFSMTKTYCDVNLDSYGLHNGEVEEHIRRRDPIREYTTTLEMSRKLIRPIEGRAPYHVPSSLMASVVTLKKQEMLNESLFSEDDL